MEGSVASRVAGQREVTCAGEARIEGANASAGLELPDVYKECTRGILCLHDMVCMSRAESAQRFPQTKCMRRMHTAVSLHGIKVSKRTHHKQRKLYLLPTRQA